MTLSTTFISDRLSLRLIAVFLLLAGVFEHSVAQDAAESSFSLDVSGRVQLRSTFVRSQQSDDDSSFELERGRLDFLVRSKRTGTGAYLNLDADTDDDHQVIGHDFWIEQSLSDAATVFLGKAFVPGSREWLDGSTGTQFADRSMATTFFRPDRSIGLWVSGAIAGTHYRAMVADGFDSNDFDEARWASRPAYALSAWRYAGDLDYKSGRSDLSYHQLPSFRYGVSLTQAGIDPTERYAGTSVALSNGQSLKEVTFAAPGELVKDTNLTLLSIDAGMKWKGLSIHGEAYARRLGDIKTLSGFSSDSIYDYGMGVDLGYVLVPSQLEIALRHSRIDGASSTSQEFMIGLSWFIDGTHRNKLAADFGSIRNYAADNSGPNYTPGQVGYMSRLLLQLSF